MKPIRWLGTILGAAIVLAGSPGSGTAAERPNADVFVDEILGQTDWPVTESAVPRRGAELGAGAHVLAFQREVLPGGVAHYAMRLRVGRGAHDFVGLHRVVKERRPWDPIRTGDAIFLQHGDAKDFRGMFLPGTVSPVTPDDFGLAVFLAQRDVDVWGIDQGWTLVPEETTDFSFMEDWGLQRQVDDLRLAMAVARGLRFLTGSGFDPLLLLGYSSGGMTGYAALNEEAGLPSLLRQVAGFVCADMSYKTDDEVWRQVGFCDFVEPYRLRLQAGEYNEFIPFALIAQLARTAPDDESPLIPGLTNVQAAMFFGGGPIFGDGKTHYWGATWEDGLPADFRFVTIDEAFDFMAAGVPWEALRFMYDYAVVVCDEEDTPFDDHLAQVTVPILDLGTRGGIGTYSAYTTTLLGSTDITLLTISVEADATMDFGHIDLFTAHDAPVLAWEPLREWIGEHSSARAAPREAPDVMVAERAGVTVRPNPGGSAPYQFTFRVEMPGRAAVEIFDVAGRRVATPLDGMLPAGEARVMWDGVTPGGRALGEGVYFARVTTPSGAFHSKFVHLDR